MKHFLLASTLLVLSLALGATVANADNANPLALSITCGDVNATTLPFQNGHCTEGMVTFRGSNYPETAYLKVLSYPAGVLIDSGAYSAAGGSLTFTQTLVPAGSYSVTVSSDEAGTDVLTTMMVTVDPL